MRMIHVHVRPGPFRTMILGAIALCAAHAALAQEGAPAGGGDAPQAGDGVAAKGMTPDVEPFTPQRGLTGLQRRANVKALIANARSGTAGLPSANLHVVSPTLRPAMEAAPPRNAIGIAMPGVQLQGRGVTAPAGTRSSGIGAPAGHVVGMTRQAPLPPFPIAGQTLHGAGINGTVMGRAALNSGSVGGPAKDRSGINGTLMPSKH
jgi:hypothetical protein